MVVCEVNGAVIEPEDADQETKELWNQHSELEKKLPHLRGELGAQATKQQKSQFGEPRGSNQNCSRAARSCGKSRRGGCRVAGSLTKVRVTKKFCSLKKEPECISNLFSNITCWSALAEKFILFFHVVSFTESHFIRDQSSNVESVLGRQWTRFFFVAASPSSK